uniref:MFS domain-containing protein n=1 Tax=Heterorhabditis bacteriophora TaxID=37862 RepID=A0A1I7WNV1_HETBA
MPLSAIIGQILGWPFIFYFFGKFDVKNTLAFFVNKIYAKFSFIYLTFRSMGFIGQTLFLLLASLTSSPAFLVGFLSLSIGLGGICWAGFSVNHLDLAPQYAGHLMGLSNTLATLPGMICPLIVGFVVKSGIQAEWNIIFYSTAIVYSMGSFFFWKWASGDRQSWASDQSPFIGELH